MDNIIESLWIELQGLEKEAQLEILKDWAESMYNQGVEDRDTDTASIWDLTCSGIK